MLYKNHKLKLSDEQLVGTCVGLDLDKRVTRLIKKKKT